MIIRGVQKHFLPRSNLIEKIRGMIHCVHSDTLPVEIIKIIGLLRDIADKVLSGDIDKKNAADDEVTLRLKEYNLHSEFITDIQGEKITAELLRKRYFDESVPELLRELEKVLKALFRLKKGIRVGNTPQLRERIRSEMEKRNLNATSLSKKARKEKNISLYYAAIQAIVEADTGFIWFSTLKKITDSLGIEAESVLCASPLTKTTPAGVSGLRTGEKFTLRKRDGEIYLFTIKAKTAVILFLQMAKFRDGQVHKGGIGRLLERAKAEFMNRFDGLLNEINSDLENNLCKKGIEKLAILDEILLSLQRNKKKRSFTERDILILRGVNESLAEVSAKVYEDPSYSGEEEAPSSPITGSEFIAAFAIIFISFAAIGASAWYGAYKICREGDFSFRPVNSAAVFTGRVIAIILSPLAICIALLLAPFIWVCSGWPVIIKQERLGYQGKVIGILKLRSMVNENIPGKCRVTAIGKLIRPIGLDEVLQILSIAKGDMRWCGPRPRLQREISQRYVIEVLMVIMPGFCSDRIRKEGPGANLAEGLMDYGLEADREYVYRKSLLYDARLIVDILALVALKIIKGIWLVVKAPLRRGLKAQPARQVSPSSTQEADENRDGAASAIEAELLRAKEILWKDLENSYHIEKKYRVIREQYRGVEIITFQLPFLGNIYSIGYTRNDERKYILIDSSRSQGFKEFVLPILQENGVTPGEPGGEGGNIDRVLVTHCHPDHIGGAFILAREYNIPFYVHPLVPEEIDSLLKDTFWSNLAPVLLGIDYIDYPELRKKGLMRDFGEESGKPIGARKLGGENKAKFEVLEKIRLTDNLAIEVLQSLTAGAIMRGEKSLQNGGGWEDAHAAGQVYFYLHNDERTIPCLFGGDIASRIVPPQDELSKDASDAFWSILENRRDGYKIITSKLSNQDKEDKQVIGSSYALKIYPGHGLPYIRNILRNCKTPKDFILAIDIITKDLRLHDWAVPHIFREIISSTNKAEVGARMQKFMRKCLLATQAQISVNYNAFGAVRRNEANFEDFGKKYRPLGVRDVHTLQEPDEYCLAHII
ncbi:MAG: sugar transferase, partial [Candidatus Omnitrophota bacterium]